jgi:hypothetical protein
LRLDGGEKDVGRRRVYIISHIAASLKPENAFADLASLLGRDFAVSTVSSHRE